MRLSMTISDWLMVTAVILGPILAVQIQKIIEKNQERKARKMKIFVTLMTTRATTLSPSRVEALNQIDVEFYDNSKVRDIWKSLLDNYDHYPQDQNAQDFQIQLNSCAKQSEELGNRLLYEMAKSLGYNFDEVHLKRGAYIPKGHADYELDNDQIRQNLLAIFKNNKSFPVTITNIPEASNAGR